MSKKKHEEASSRYSIQKRQLVEPMIAEGGYQNADQGVGNDTDAQVIGVTQRDCGYYLQLGFLWMPNDQYIEYIKTLFNVVELEGNDDEVQPYFMRYEKAIFLAILGQLDLALNNGQDEGTSKLKASGEQLQPNCRDSDILQLFEQRTPEKFRVLQELVEFRQKAIDIYGLADKNNDKTLYKAEGELDQFWEIIRQVLQNMSLELTDESNAETFINEQQTILEQAGFDQIQEVLWKLKIKFGFDIERIQKEFYSKLVGSPSWLCCCKSIRRKCFTKGRLKPKVPKDIHYGTFKSINHFKMQAFHALDLITDGLLANEFYWLSRKDFAQPIDGSQQIDSQGPLFKGDYNICFIIVALAIFGPYIIQYSSLTYIIFSKGFFKKEKLKKTGCIKRWLFLYLSFTFLGLFIMPMIDLLLKLEAIINVLLIPFCCKIGKRSIAMHAKIMQEQLLEQMFNLNSFELENFEKQKKYTQVLFEDTFLFILQVGIGLGILRVPKITNEKFRKESNSFTILLASGFVTMFSIITTAFNMIVESNGLKEDKLQYIMLSLKAKSDWVPYGYLLKQRQISQDIDYGYIEFKLPYFTDLIGSYRGFIFQFSEASLHKLTSHLEYAMNLRKNQDQNDNNNNDDSLQNQQNGLNFNFTPKLKFGFSLNQVNVHCFCEFIFKNFKNDNNQVWKYFDLNDIDWEKLIQNSLNQEPDQDFNYIKGGVPLLQVIVDNENTEDGTWQLKDLFKLLLEKQTALKLDLNIKDYKNNLNLLTYCYDKKKHMAFKMLVNYMSTHPDARAYINNQNTNLTTIYGKLFYESSITHFENQGFQPNNKLQLIIEKFADQIDMNRPCIIQGSKHLKVPILFFISENLAGDVSLDDLQSCDQYKNYFGNNQNIGVTAFEIQQLLPFLLYGDGPKKQRATMFLDRALKLRQEQNGPDGEWFEADLKQIDEQGYNLMHITELKYPAVKWKKYIKNQNVKNLDNIIKNLLRQPNNEGQTPIVSFLTTFNEIQPNFKPLPKLIDNNLIDQNSFERRDADKLQQLFKKYFSIQYNKSRNTDKIPKTKFIKAFPNPQQAYNQLKETFMMNIQEDVFNEYLYQEEYEQPQIEVDHQQIDVNFFDELMQPKEYDSHNRIEDMPEDSSIGIIKAKMKDHLVTSKQKENKRHFIVETYIGGSIEIASMMDFISDVVILLQLVNSTDTSWFSFTLFTMVCPYYTVYASLMTFKIQDQSTNKSGQNLCQLIKNALLILPTQLFLMLLVDIVLMNVNTFMYIIMFFAMCTSKRYEIYRYFEDQQDKFFKYFFGMSVMDAKGFKCQRTILQLMLESIPQIFFQVYLLIRIPQLKKQYGASFTISIDNSVIIFSLFSAFLHVILELLNLCFESRTSNCNFAEYMIASYSARQGWIPQVDMFFEEPDHRDYIDQQQNGKSQMDYYISSEKSLIGDNLSKSMTQKRIISFDNQDKWFCSNKFGFSVVFELSNNSVQNLLQLISDMPYVDGESQQKQLHLGACIQHLDIQNILQLLKYAHNKLQISFEMDELDKIIKKSHRFLNQIRRPLEYHTEEDEEYFIVEMVAMNYTQLVQIMIDNEADLRVTSKRIVTCKNNDQTINYPRNTHLFEIAYSNKCKDMLLLLLHHYQTNLQNGELDYKPIKQLDIIHKELQKTEGLLFQPLIFLQKENLVPYDKKNSYIFTIHQKYAENEMIAKQKWNVMFGAYVPQLDYRSQNNRMLLTSLEQIRNWVSEYPSKITLCQKQGDITRKLELDSQFLTQFVVVRRSHFLHIEEQYKSNLNKIIDVTELLKDIDCTLEDIRNVYKIFHNEHRYALLDDIRKCDKIVKKFGFDMNWSKYYHNSRQITHCAEGTQTSGGQNTLTLAQNVLAVKELIIIKKDQEATPTQFVFSFEMDHYNGWMNIDRFQYIDNNDQVVLNINYETDDNLIEGFQFKKIKQVLMNQISANHKLSVTLKNADNQVVQSEIKVVTYVTQ